VGKGLEDVAQFFLATKLFFFDPKSWVEFIKKDRWAAGSGSFLFAMLMLTYVIVNVLGQKTFSYSGGAYQLANAILLLVFGICIGIALKVLGSPNPLLISVSAAVYVNAVGLPVFWLYLLISTLIGFENTTTPSIGFTVVRAFSGSMYGL